MLIKNIELHRIEKFRTRQFNYMLNKLNLPYYSTILDVGCGDGLFTSLLYEYEKNKHGSHIPPHIIAIDSNSKQINENWLKYPEINFKTLDILDTNINTLFDLVIVKDVLHHCDKPKLVYEKIKSFGKNTLIIEANKENYWLSMFKGHEHFSTNEFKKITGNNNIYFINVFYPISKLMVLFSFLPYIPKSKNAFMISYVKSN